MKEGLQHKIRKMLCKKYKIYKDKNAILNIISPKQDKGNQGKGLSILDYPDQV